MFSQRYEKKRPRKTPGASLGTRCKVDLNHLWPWVEKIWALHPYFPELMEKKRAPLEGVELVR